MARNAAKSNVVLIGRPNVGKSSLFNRLAGRRQAITHEDAGTTRDATSTTVDWTGHHFTLVDTAGLTRAADDIEIQSQDQLRAAIATADLVVQVVDANTILTDQDLVAAQLAHRTNKPHITAVNKLDSNREVDLDQYRKLGTEAIVPVSALHGIGSGDLLDAICERIDRLPERPEKSDHLGLAFLGRPNVGKSSLVNSLVGKQTTVVSAQPGTTRDVLRAEVKYHGKTIDLYDTAGIRKPGSVERGVEKFSVLRTLASIKQADVCALVIDATEPATAMDQRIAGLAIEAGRGLILVVNKWDAVEADDKSQAKLTKRLEKEFQFAWWAPVVFVSAETGLNTPKLFELATEIATRRAQTFPTGPLNRTIETLTTKQPPAGLKRRQPKINYVTQTSTNPPTVTLFGSALDEVHFSYKRYIENGLREAYDLVGTPIALEARSKPRRSAK